MTDYRSSPRRSGRRDDLPMGLLFGGGALALLGVGALVLMSMKSPLPDPNARPQPRPAPAKAAPAVKAQKRVAAEDLHREYAASASKADASYKGKLLDVEGTLDVVAVGDDGKLFLQLQAKEWQPGVKCLFDESRRGQLKSFKPGDRLVVQGTCGGFPESGDAPRVVVLNNCRSAKKAD